MRILWDLYGPVRLLLGIYLVAVAVGVVLEGMALAAIVPLISGAGAEGFGGVYGRMIEAVGLDPTSDTSLVVIVGVLFLLRSVAQYTSKVLAGVMVRREGVQLQVELFRLYLRTRWDVVLGISQGEANLLFGSQTQKVAQFLRQCVMLLEGVVYAVGLTVVAIVVSPQNTLIAVALIGASAVGVSVIATRIRTYADQTLQATKGQAGILLQYVRGVQMLRSYDVSEHAVRDVEDLAKQREQLTYRAERIQALSTVLPDLIFVLALLTVVGLAFRSGEGLAEIGAVVALLFRISQYLKRFSAIPKLSAAVPTVKDVHRYRQQFLRSQSSTIDETVDPTLAPGSLVLADLRFDYTDPPTRAVSDVSKTIEPGEFIGIVGTSGSGKSTLISLLVGLLEPDRGRVRVGVRTDGDDGRRLAYVPQSPFVLKGSIASNVRWFRPIDDDRIERACRSAGLLSLLERLPDGIHTPVEQEGLTLSGGERQRLALARALAGEPDILVLDEATSALDSESEAAIKQALDDMHGTVTVISIAHRLSTVLSADRVWVMEHGTIVEDAPPDELLRRDGSRFAELSSLQGIQSTS